MEDGFLVGIWLVSGLFVLMMAVAIVYDCGGHKFRACTEGDQVIYRSVVYECTPVFELEKR